MNIKLLENKDVIVTNSNSIQGEINSSKLIFELPDKIGNYNISELNVYLVFDIEGMSPILITSQDCHLPEEVTENEMVIAQIYIMKEKTMLYKSKIFELYFESTIECSYVVKVDDIDIINSLIEQYNELLANAETVNDTLLENEENRKIVFNELENLIVYNLDLLSEQITNIEDLTKIYKNDLESYKNLIGEQVEKFQNINFNINKKGNLEVILDD